MARKITEKMKEKAKARREHFAQLTARLPKDPEEIASVASDLFIKNVEGHELSAANQILLTYQRENVTVVGGFQQWKKVGRHVKKGESSLCIWVPAKDRKASTTAPADTSSEGNKIFFFMGSVFDISQTEITEEVSEDVESEEVDNE